MIVLYNYYSILALTLVFLIKLSALHILCSKIVEDLCIHRLGLVQMLIAVIYCFANGTGCV